MDELIVECVYGWGRVMRLYDNHLDLNGTSYVLVDLVSVRSLYHHLMGIASVRLILRFRQKLIVLRGIPTIAKAQRAVVYLNEICAMHTVGSAGHAQGLAPFPSNVYRESRQTDAVLLLPEAAYLSDGMLGDASGEFVQASEGSQVEQSAVTAPLKVPRWQVICQEQRIRRLKRSQAQRSLREHGFNVEQLAERLQETTLPQVSVPTRLLPGEQAHYCSDATLCEEPLPGVAHPNYQIKDQGLLILTSRRIIYIGRKRQLVLGYGRLLHVSQLHGAIAVLSESWIKREIFEVRLPLECIMYLDAILLRFRQQKDTDERAHAHVRPLYPAINAHSISSTTQDEIIYRT